MCIGVPMQVLALEPGHARCQGRGEVRRVSTALVDGLQAGDWVLVFLDSAREHITATRAQEVNDTLDLLAAVQAGEAGDAAAGFALPSRWSTSELLALTGQPPTPETTP